MKAIVMAGGFGTRLRPLTINTPKPMVPIGTVPMMDFVVDRLVQSGLTDVTSLLYFHPGHIERHYGDGSAFGVKMGYRIPNDDLGTAGAVRYAVGDSDEPVLVISGDLLTDFDLKAAIQWHKERRADATILLTRVENPTAYGIVITDDDGRIVRFLEKPTWGEAFSDTINTGIYILEPQAARLIPNGENFDFSQDLFPLMLKEKMGLYGRITDGYWKDVGNVDEYFRAHGDLFAQTLKLDLKLQREDLPTGILYRGKNVTLADDAVINGMVILSDDVRVGLGTALHNCAVGARTCLEGGCDLRDSLIWSDSRIGSGSRFSRALVGANVTLGHDVQLLDNAIVADDCRIGDGATVKANCKIWPAKTVEKGAIVSASVVWGDKWNRELFVDSKVSGLALTEITPEMAVKIGAAMGASLGSGTTVVTSRDTSHISRLFRMSITSGLLSAGVSVADLRSLPVPVVRHALSRGDYAAGIFVRHNPADYRNTDLIFFHGSAQDMPKSKLKKIERNYFGEDYERVSPNEIGQLDYPQKVLANYQEEFWSNLDVDSIRDAGFKIVVDYAHGASSQVFPDLFTKLGVSATELYSRPNPLKSSVSPEESVRAVVQLSAIVRSLNADIGLHINPAAEKLTVIDESGQPLDPQVLLLVVTDLFLRTNSVKKIAVPISASMGIEEIAQRHGVEVTRVTNDHQAMMDIFASGEVEFVGGTRGGFIFSDFQRGADALFAAARILQMLALTRTRIGELRRDYAHLVRQSVSVPCPWSRKGTVMRRLITESDHKRRQLVDGVRIFEDDGWVLIAPDRFNAAFSISAESSSRERTERLLSSYQSVVQRCQKS